MNDRWNRVRASTNWVRLRLLNAFYLMLYAFFFRRVEKVQLARGIIRMQVITPPPKREIPIMDGLEDRHERIWDD